MLNTLTLLAQATENAINKAPVFEFSRIQKPSDWVLPIVVMAGLAVFVVLVYLRDSIELSKGIAVLLIGLRLAAYAGLFWVFLKPSYRVDRELREESRLMVLVDTSLSMGLTDSDSGSASTNVSRADQVLAALKDKGLLEKFRQSHEVLLMRFDSDRQVVSTLSRIRIDPNDPLAAANALVEGAQEAPVEWDKLAPQGTETRLGEAVRDAINDNRSAPLVGLVLFTDGQQNVGIESETAIQTAIEAKLPVYCVGMGSNKTPPNIRIADLVAPPRAYQDDSFTVVGYIQGQEMAGKTVSVELVSRPAGVPPGTEETAEIPIPVTLGAQGESSPVRFTLEAKELGRRTLTLKVQTVDGESSTKDNLQEVDVEVVKDETRVLLFAGGPSREYQFLRNQLYRDPNVKADVLLQSFRSGTYQEADELLTDFPNTMEQMNAYDCIVAFDPDWRTLSDDQVKLLEKWVSEKAGGMIVLAGPVYTEEWTQSDRMSILRNMYPVEFHKRFSLLDAGRFQNKEAWPVDLTREGSEAEFLWLKEESVPSRIAWQSLEGVYGYFSVRGGKQGATIYGSYSDPRASDGDSQPVYMAGHFYGIGRVFYMGSGEMWRARAIDTAYFDRFYTKLIRHVVQGRLLRGSKRGVLLVERDRYLLGDTVAVQAQINDAEDNPLRLDNVALDVISPTSGLQRVLLMPDPAGRAGAYQGQFVVRQEGAYRLDLAIPGVSEEEKISKRIQVRVPDLEREKPQRDDARLTAIADRTGGKYYIGTENLDKLPDLEALAPRPRISTFSDEPQPIWDSAITLWILASIMCLEWLIRKLVRLA